jgi:hypothetical protein
MNIKPSRNFEGSGTPEERLIEYAAQRNWIGNTHQDALAVFFKAANLGIEKKRAVQVVSAWLVKTTELSGNPVNLMPRANYAYSQVKTKQEED